MAGLRLKLKNFRAIADADIELADLTVLSGVNASGKSTVARLFHNVIETNRTYDILGRRLAFWRAFMVYFDAFMCLLDDSKLEVRKVERVFDSILLAKDDVELFDAGIERLKDTFSILLLDAKTEGRKIEKRVWAAFCRAVEKEDMVASNDDQNILESFTNWINSRFELFDSCCNLYLCKDRNRLPFLLEADLLGEPVAGKKVNEQVTQITIMDGKKKIFDSAEEKSTFPEIYSPKRSFYIENPSSTLPSIKEGKLILGAAKYTLPEKNKQMEQFIYTAKEEINYDFLGGGFEAPKNQDAFSEQDWIYTRTDGSTFDLKVCAEGIKSFAAIPILDGYGLLDSNTLLIIDEPEVHLHPQWIVKCAEILVELIKKRRMRILVTSHSPYLVQALQQNACKKLKPEQCCFYLAEQKEEFTYSYQRLGMNIAPIFRTFNVALDQIAEISE